MLSKQAKDPGGLETRTVNLQVPGFFSAIYSRGFRLGFSARVRARPPEPGAPSTSASG